MKPTIVGPLPVIVQHSSGGIIRIKPQGHTPTAIESLQLNTQTSTFTIETVNGKQASVPVMVFNDATNKGESVFRSALGVFGNPIGNIFALRFAVDSRGAGQIHVFQY